MAPVLDQMTEVLQADVARFPRAKLSVVKGPDKGAEVLLEGQTVVIGSDESCQLRLADSSVSRRHVELSGGPGGYRLRDLRSTNGVFIEGVQVLDARLIDKTRFTLGRNELRFEPERSEVQWPLSALDQFGDVLGKSLVMRRLFALLERAAATESPVVLEGEAGTGKEGLARAIHERSSRREGPFVVVDLGASNEALMESDLFGHDVSAARPVARPGAIEEAEGGTLYLDDVTELSNSLQAKLLRALETKEFKRPGPQGMARVDVRVIASTQKDLDAEVKAGRFREDLSFRLSVFRVRVPPLRERPEDIPQLVRHFEVKAKGSTPLSDDTVEMLTRHDWPGNVRELRSVLERLAAFPDLGAGAIARALGKSMDAPSDDPKDIKARNEISQQLLSLPYHEAKDRVLESFEKTYLLEHLRAAKGVVTHAAQRAGLPRQSVHRMLRRLGINAGDE
jgi:DNA-binding NtrC family response regulator